MPLLMRKYELEKKGHKIRAWVNPPPLSGNARIKPYFLDDVFPYNNDLKINLYNVNAYLYFSLLW